MYHESLYVFSIPWRTLYAGYSVPVGHASLLSHVTISSMPSFRGCRPLDTDLQKFAQICLSFICTSHIWYLCSHGFFNVAKVGALHHFIVEDHRRSKVVFATTAGSFERDCWLTAVGSPSCEVHAMQFTKKVVGVKQAKDGPELWAGESSLHISGEYILLMVAEVTHRIYETQQWPVGIQSNLSHVSQRWDWVHSLDLSDHLTIEVQKKKIGRSWL